VHRNQGDGFDEWVVTSAFMSSLVCKFYFMLCGKRLVGAHFV